jgi:UDP:flavonoid glycosyltransferase YjiC (YdhE family)
MATIAFFLYPNTGHWNPSFALASELRGRGHRIIYVGPTERCEEVTNRGFPYEPALEDNGSLVSSDHGPPDLIFLASWLLERHRECPEEFEKLSARVMPDVVVYDALLPFWGLIARKWDCPAVGIAFSPPLHKDRDVPPLTSSWVPRGTILSRSVSAGLWWTYRIRRYLNARDWPDGPLPMLCPGDPRGRAEVRQLKGFANDLGLGDMIHPRETIWVPMLRTPVIVTSPREMDLPRNASETVTYGGPSIDLDRSGLPMPWEGAEDRKPMVACSFGTSYRMLPHAERTRRFRAVIRGVGEAGDVQLVIAVGDEATVRAVSSIPEARNAVVVKWFPQMGVLTRACLMITHGGWGTVKECVYHGVPMLVSPIANDHRGAAARVQFHGLGSVIKERDFVPARFREAVRTILADQAMKQRLRRMSGVLRDFEAKSEAADLIETLARGTARN